VKYMLLAKKQFKDLSRGSGEKRPLASSCVSVCPSFRSPAWNNSVSARRIFMKTYVHLCDWSGLWAV
jgi:hypothetical protein